MVILLVYGNGTEPETLILHGSDGKTWLSLANTMRPVSGLANRIQKTLNTNVFIFLCYLLFLLILFVFQRRLVYFPEKYSIEQQQVLAERFNLKLWPSKDNYLGLMAKSANTDYKGTIIVFHGNAGSAINRIYYSQALEKLGYRVILAEYPGYGARDGLPSETALISNGIETLKRALNDFGEPIFLWGESLGSGVVGGIMQTGRIQVKGLVLVTPFDSLATVPQHYYWIFLAKWLVRDEFNNIKNLQNYQGSIAILLADEYEIIPNKYSLALFDSLHNRKRHWLLSPGRKASITSPKPTAGSLPGGRNA